MRLHTLTLPAIALAAALAAGASLSGSTPKFFPDDPLTREPETQDASKVRAWDIILAYDLALNSFATPGDATALRAMNVNTIDEVPDSNWFTNRILAREISTEELMRGPVTGPGPAPGPLTVERAKPAGVSPGFVLRDSAGVLWFVQFDAPKYPNAASGASMVANRLFWALGYWQAENHLAELGEEDLVVGPKAVTETPSGHVRPIGKTDIRRVLSRAARQPNGAYRMLASRAVNGTPLGAFKYYGTRPDDPNDVVPHEHRRELRALKVFGAWANLVDMKAGNTLDALVTENGRAVVRHYLQDVGSTFGTGALGPRDWDEGYEYLFEGNPLWKRLVSFGFYIRPWQTVDYEDVPEIGRFEGTAFDPEAWRPRVPGRAILNARPDDTFWAARRVAAFTDAQIRAMVRVGGYADPRSEAHLADVLIARRNRIAEVYLPKVNPIVDLSLAADGTLRFRNAAVDAGVAAAPSGGYQARWFAFDNAAGTSRPIGESVSFNATTTTAPTGLPPEAGAYVRVDLSASDPARAAWAVPVQAYFRREAAGWRWVGLERQ